MEERKHWLLSRKFWLAVLTAITMILSDEFGIELGPETIVAIILPVVAYILGEAYVDAQGVKKNNPPFLSSGPGPLLPGPIDPRRRPGAYVVY